MCPFHRSVVRSIGNHAVEQGTVAGDKGDRDPHTGTPIDRVHGDRPARRTNHDSLDRAAPAREPRLADLAFVGEPVARDEVAALDVHAGVVALQYQHPIVH